MFLCFMPCYRVLSNWCVRQYAPVAGPNHCAVTKYILLQRHCPQMLPNFMVPERSLRHRLCVIGRGYPRLWVESREVSRTGGRQATPDHLLPPPRRPSEEWSCVIECSTASLAHHETNRLCRWWGGCFTCVGFSSFSFSWK